MLDFIAFPLGKLMLFIYENLAFLNYGLAIIIFTVIIKIILLPLNVKQYQSMAKTQEVQPKLQEIQQRYKNDKEKLNQELMNFYKENNINPMGGCFPMLIQMPILFSLYYVISQPLKFMLNVGASGASLMDLISNKYTGTIVATINSMYGKLSAADKYGSAQDINIINYAHLNSANLDKLGTVANVTSGDLANISKLDMNFINHSFNLGLIPQWNIFAVKSDMRLEYIALLIIPVLAAVTTFFSIKYSMAKNPSATQGNDMAQSMNKNMLLMMPVMTGLFAFNAPAGLGVYWCVNNIIQILQQMFMNKFILKKKEEVATKQNGV